MQLFRKNPIEVDQDLKLMSNLQRHGCIPMVKPEQVIELVPLSNHEQMQNIEMGILEDQVVDHIMNQAQVEIIESSYDDVLSGRAIAPPEAEEGADAESAGEESANTEEENK